MDIRSPQKWLLIGVLLSAAALFGVGLTWGLPAGRVNAYLFGDRKPWSGADLLRLAPGWDVDAIRGADVAAHPLEHRDRPIVLNATDVQRAAIVRRYRLYSDQPDEMITLRALAQMKPGLLQLDPRLYQYGGLWIYPVGALLKIASLVHAVRLTPELAFYLDHPAAFGRLYVVMRLYSLAWGLLGVFVMFRLAMRLGGSAIAATTAAMCYALLPAVINAAHEAKPHLAGAVLGLIAIDLALGAIGGKLGRGSIGHGFTCGVACGVACGAAASMVLSGWLAIGVLPVMAFFLPRRRVQTLALACGCAMLVYAICNPYVIIHLLGDRAVLRSNLQNSAAMYQTPASLAAIGHGLLLMFDSGSFLVFVGMIAIAALAMRREPIGWLLLAATLPGLCVFLLHAGGKPGEYGRFALPMDVCFVLAIAVAMGCFKRPAEQIAVGSALILILLPMSASYVWHYGRETFDRSTRLIVADRLVDLAEDGANVLAIDAEPAPYSLPPVNLFHWKIVLLPKNSSMPRDADVRIDAVDTIGTTGKETPSIKYWIRPRLLPTALSWAAKPFRVTLRPGAAFAAPARK